jgi:hypothetical protein
MSDIKDFHLNTILASQGLSRAELPELIQTMDGQRCVTLPGLAKFLHITKEALAVRVKKFQRFDIGTDYLLVKSGLGTVGAPRTIYTREGAKKIIMGGPRKPPLRYLDTILDALFDRPPTITLERKKPRAIARRSRLHRDKSEAFMDEETLREKKRIWEQLGFHLDTASGEKINSPIDVMEAGDFFPVMYAGASIENAVRLLAWRRNQKKERRFAVNRVGPHLIVTRIL